MAKDPAFLFYPDNWIVGTMHMQRITKACYLDLLMLQFARGMFTEAEARTVLGEDWSQWELLKDKFTCENSMYYNHRLNKEINKRKVYNDSRKNGAYAMHMRMHGGNGNVIGISNGISINSINQNTVENSNYAQFKTNYPDKGSAINPAVENFFINNVDVNIELIMSRAIEYADYWKQKEPDTYPHCKHMKQAINWLREKQYEINWSAKMNAEIKESIPQWKRGVL